MRVTNALRFRTEAHTTDALDLAASVALPTMTSPSRLRLVLCLLSALFAGCGAVSAPDPIEIHSAPRMPVHTNDDVWRGLARHEIQLGQKLLVVRGAKGVVGCPYLDVGMFEKAGEACAIVPAADTAGMLDAKVTAVTAKAKDLGITVGMSGREALERIR